MTMNSTRKLFTTAALGLSLCVAAASTAQADVRPYQGVPADQAEAITTPEHLISIVQSGAPTAIWQALEHAETVECLGCIPYVAPLLYDASSARNREIAAWWLRRRILGVFGPGQVYQQTLNTLATDPSATRRAYAASALGEFLVLSGVAPVANALLHDSDPGVRAASASALGRLNDDGSGALAKAFTDSDATVRAAAYVAAGRVNSFADVTSAVAAVTDSDPTVRRVGIELLDEMGPGATDAADSVLRVAQNDADDEVRLVACHALGNIGEQSMVPDLQEIATNDSNMQVQDQAKIAVIRLSR
jgi:HEAT repeat protein